MNGHSYVMQLMLDSTPISSRVLPKQVSSPLLATIAANFNEPMFSSDDRLDSLVVHSLMIQITISTYL